MNSEVQYLLLKWNKMLLFLIVHLSVYDVSYVHHCNNTSSSHSFAKLLKNTERAFPYQNGKNSCLFGASATHDSNREPHSQLNSLKINFSLMHKSARGSECEYTHW